MKLTKYPQSCVMIDTKGKKILVDPGALNYEESFLKDWGEADIILITHKHADHIHAEVVKELDGKIYSTAEVAQAYPELEIATVKEGDKIEEMIEAVKAVHGYMPFLKDGKQIQENIGYIIHGDKTVYLTGDTISFENDYECDIIFVPVCDHGLVMGPFEAAHFAKETGARLVIPYHYDNPKFPADMDKVKEEFEKQELNYTILDTKETKEV